MDLSTKLFFDKYSNTGILDLIKNELAPGSGAAEHQARPLSERVISRSPGPPGDLEGDGTEELLEPHTTVHQQLAELRRRYDALRVQHQALQSRSDFSTEEMDRMEQDLVNLRARMAELTRNAEGEKGQARQQLAENRRQIEQKEEQIKRLEGEVEGLAELAEMTDDERKRIKGVRGEQLKAAEEAKKKINELQRRLAAGVDEADQQQLEKRLEEATERMLSFDPAARAMLHLNEIDRQKLAIEELEEENMKLKDQAARGRDISQGGPRASRGSSTETRSQGEGGGCEYEYLLLPYNKAKEGLGALGDDELNTIAARTAVKKKKLWMNLVTDDNLEKAIDRLKKSVFTYGSGARGPGAGARKYFNNLPSRPPTNPNTLYVETIQNYIFVSDWDLENLFILAVDLNNEEGEGNKLAELAEVASSLEEYSINLTIKLKGPEKDDDDEVGAGRDSQRREGGHPDGSGAGGESEEGGQDSLTRRRGAPGDEDESEAAAQEFEVEDDDDDEEEDHFGGGGWGARVAAPSTLLRAHSVHDFFDIKLVLNCEYRIPDDIEYYKLYKKFTGRLRLPRGGQGRVLKEILNPNTLKAKYYHQGSYKGFILFMRRLLNSLKEEGRKELIDTLTKYGEKKLSKEAEAYYDIFTDIMKAVNLSEGDEGGANETKKELNEDLSSRLYYYSTTLEKKHIPSYLFKLWVDLLKKEGYTSADEETTINEIIQLSKTEYMKNPTIKGFKEEYKNIQKQRDQIVKAFDSINLQMQGIKRRYGMFSNNNYIKKNIENLYTKISKYLDQMKQLKEHIIDRKQVFQDISQQKGGGDETHQKDEDLKVEDVVVALDALIIEIDGKITNYEEMLDDIKLNYNVEGMALDTPKDKYLKELYQKLNDSSSRNINDEEYKKQCEQVRRINYNSIGYTNNPELFQKIEDEKGKCNTSRDNQRTRTIDNKLKRRVDEQNLTNERLKLENNMEKKYRDLEDQLMNKYKNKGETPGSTSKDPTVKLDKQTPPSDKIIPSVSKKQTEDKGVAKLIPDGMGGFKLLKPSDKNIEKIEEVMGDDKKMRLIKDKNIKDFDMDDIKDVDIILGGVTDINNTYYKLLDEYYNYKKIAKRNEVNGIKLLINKEKVIEELKNIILRLKANLEKFREACVEEVLRVNEEKDKEIDEKNKEIDEKTNDFKEVFKYLRELFKEEIKSQLSTTKHNIKLLKADKDFQEEKIKYLEDKALKKKAKTQRTPKKAKVQEAPKKAKVQKAPKKAKVQEAPKKAKVQRTPKKANVQRTPKKANVQRTPKKVNVQRTPKKAKGPGIPKRGITRSLSKRRKPFRSSKKS